MNLYKLMFECITRSDSETGLTGYLLAENDEQVYRHIDKEHNRDGWRDHEDDEPTETEDDDGNEIEETFKEKILRQKGQIGDDDANDLDGGDYLILYGWELLKENVTGDYAEMIELGIIAIYDEESSAQYLRDLEERDAYYAKHGVVLTSEFDAIMNNDDLFDEHHDDDIANCC